MASKDKLKIMLSFMREINDGNKPKASDYDITTEEFWKIIDACQDEGLIKGATIYRLGETEKIGVCNIENVMLTVKGMQYLHDNSTIMKTYKGLKEIREWLPW